MKNIRFQRTKVRKIPIKIKFKLKGNNKFVEFDAIKVVRVKATDNKKYEDVLFGDE